MKHTIEELIDVVHRHYPRGIDRHDPRYERTEEYARLRAARLAAAAADAPWKALWRRLVDRFPECDVMSYSLHLPMGQMDAGYCGGMSPRTPPEGEYHHGLGYLVSFLVPYYAIYTSRVVDDGPMYEEDAQVWATDQRAKPVDGLRPLKRVESPRKRRRETRFEVSPGDEAYSAHLVKEIEGTFGCERMLPDIGLVVVPDVSTNLRPIGQATIYDCLMSDQLH